MKLTRITSLFPTRVPILYAIMSVLLLVSVVPMYFYANRVVASNEERLKANEMLLQNTVTRSVVDELTQRNITLRMMLDNLSSAVAVSSGGNLAGDRVSSPELRAILDQFVGSYSELAYASVENSDGHGYSSRKIEADSFMEREFVRAFDAAREGRPYNSQPLTVHDGKKNHTLMIISHPLMTG